MVKTYKIEMELTRSEWLMIESLLWMEQVAFDDITKGFNSAGGRKMKTLTTARARQISEQICNKREAME
jgi:hypothetical protein